MDTTVNKPKTIAELLPGLSGILSKDAVHTLTAQKAPRKTIASTRTDEKVIKQPLTLAEMRANLKALTTSSSKRCNQTTASNKKKWNSSVKVDKKTTSHTAGGQMKHTTVRKVLNFQLPKPKPIKMSMMPNSRMTMNHETPKFPKPELKVKKSIHVPAKTNVRISGVYQIPETPVYNRPLKSRMTLANKENVTNQATLNRKTIAEHQLTKININKKLVATPKSALRQVRINVISDTPLSNESWKSSCDASFLQNEKDIDFIEEKCNALLQEQTLEDIAEISPPVSTPFKDYRNVTEFFNNSNVNYSTSVCQDNTIMTFDPPNNCKQNGIREESVIVSLCELLNKATVSNVEQHSTELDDLLKSEQEIQNKINVFENVIRSLENIKQSEIISLQNIRKVIQEKREKETRISESEKDKTVIEIPKDLSPKPCSVIKSLKSPSYKIPKKNTCLRKKVIHKSMPNVSYLSPQKDMGDRAFNMYMQMKGSMQFLSTPLVKQRTEVPDTPAITSHNLQKQLDKLYTES